MTVRFAVTKTPGQLAIAEAYKVVALRGSKLSPWKALQAATRGAAQALGLGQEIGHLGGRYRRLSPT